MSMWPTSENMAFSPKDEVKSELLSCRACLGSGRLYNMHTHGLAEPYRQLVGVEVCETSPLPQHMCVWCSCMLIKCATFRERCRRAEKLLQNLSVINSAITAEEISSIDRYTQKLTPPYVQTQPTSLNCTEDDKFFLNTDETNSVTDNDVTFDDEYKNDTTFKSVAEIDNDDDDVKNDIKTGIFEDKKYLKCEEKSEKRTSKRTRKQVIKKTNEKLDSPRATRSNKKVKIETNSVENTEKPPITVSKSNEKIETKSKVRKTKPRVNNLYTDPEDREKFSQKYDVDIIVMTKEDEMNDMLERKNSSKYLRAHNKCEECYKGFIHEDTLKRHIKDKHDPNLEYVCEFCRFRFSKRVNLTGHYRRHHKYKYICRVCNVVTRMREHAVQHSKMHTQKFECKYCGKTFNTKGTTYHAHVRKKHAAELPWCRLCGDAFVCTKTHMERLHKETLNSDPALQCSTCNTQFLNTQALYSHTNTQTSCKEVKSCAHCGDGFQAEQMLRDHVLNVHKIQFPCDKCNKVFSHESKLNNHMLEKHSDSIDRDAETHKGGRKRYMKVVPAMCDICGKIIADQYHMVYHQRIHTGEKPYACAHCPKHFRMPEQLQNHVRIHTGERPFKCKYCPNTFKTYPAMSRHHLVHTGVRRYPCSICGKPFATTAEMKTHVKTVHMKIPAPPRNRRRNKNVLL